VQIHDFNPGFGPAVDPNGSNGLGDRVFWTTPIDDSDVTVHFGAGKAELSVSNLNISDFLSKKNALGSNWNNPPYGATVSFDVVWDAPITRRLDFQEGTNVDHFSGTFEENQATVNWSASNTNGFTFTANTGDFSTSSAPFAELAHEKNGSFFNPDSGDSNSAVAQSLAQSGAHPLLGGIPRAPLPFARLPAPGQSATPVVAATHAIDLAFAPDPGGSASAADGSELAGDILFRL
jgi:hypothetical protein